jgi:starvation-inducible DNA-binding protein
VTPAGGISEQHKAVIQRLRAAHEVTDKADEYPTTGMIEVWIDEVERRAWLLFEATR